MRFSLPNIRPSGGPTQHLPALSEKVHTPSYGTTFAHSDAGDDDQSTANLMPHQTASPIEPPSLKIKRVDHYYSSWSKCWKYKNSGSNTIPEMRPIISAASSGKNLLNDPWQGYCFVVVRKLPKKSEAEYGAEPTFKIVIKSPYLLKACKDVMQDIPGVSWTMQPLEV